MTQDGALWEKVHLSTYYGYGVGMRPVSAYDYGLLAKGVVFEAPEALIDAILADHEQAQRVPGLEAELALRRKQLRNAWAKLECRCIFNEQDEKTHEDPHCPYHGFYQNDPDGWMPVGEQRERAEAAERERDEALTVVAAQKSQLAISRSAAGINRSGATARLADAVARIDAGAEGGEAGS